MSAHDERQGHADERLADWVDGRMDPAERAEFEAWLSEDAARQAEAESYRGTVEAVRGALRHGPHAPRDFADRVLAATRADRSPERAARARRFAWKASAAAAAVFTLLFFLVERLAREPRRAEDLASSAEGARSGLGEPRAENGVFDVEGFVGPSADAGRELLGGVASVTVLEEPEAAGFDAFFVDPEAAPIGFGGGGERFVRAPGVGGGGGGGGGAPAGGLRTGPAGPSTPGPATAGPGAPAPRRDARSGDATDLSFDGGTLAEGGPIGALVYVITWPEPPAEEAPRERAQEAEAEAETAGRKAAQLPVRTQVLGVDPVVWFRAQVEQLPQGNVIVLPTDVVPLDLEPARLALGAVAEEEAPRKPGEFWPLDGDLAFRLPADAAQRERLLRGLVLAAREQGATLTVRRSRFRRLDLRADDGEVAADVALVLRGRIPQPPPRPSGSEQRR